MNKISENINEACAAACAAAQTLAFTGEKKLRERMEAADTVEYVLMAAVFCLGITVVAFLLRDRVAGIFNGIRINLEHVSNTQNNAVIH